MIHGGKHFSVMEMGNIAFNGDSKVAKILIWMTERAGKSESIMKFKYRIAMVISKLNPI